jgi:hypothetical protein
LEVKPPQGYRISGQPRRRTGSHTPPDETAASAPRVPKNYIFFPLIGGTEMSQISLHDRIAKALGRDGENISNRLGCCICGGVVGHRSAVHGIPIVKNLRRACRYRSHLECSENSI